MPFLSKTDFKTHLYSDIIDAISEADESILQDAIDAGIGEAKGYLSKYDTDILFNGVTPDPTLLLFVKDLVVWHFIVLSNASIELGFREDRYTKAIAWLKNIQSGKIVFKNWALPATTTDSSGFLVTSRPKRNNYL